MKDSTRSKVTAHIVEEDQEFEMTAEGQNSDFNSDRGKLKSKGGNASRLIESDSQLTLCSGRKLIAMEDDDETEVFFKQQDLNNSATPVLNSDDSGDEMQTDEELEPGQYLDDEQSQQASEPDSSQPAPDENEKGKTKSREIDEKLSQMQSYFERKFDDMSKVMELERQLAENQRKLLELKARGNNQGRVAGQNSSGSVDIARDDDSQSELTIYKDAIEKKRGSASSEDDLIDTSDELLDVRFVENELLEDRRREKGSNRRQSDNREDQPGTSGMSGAMGRSTNREAAEDRGAALTQEADGSQVRAKDVSGKMIDNQLSILRRQSEAVELNPKVKTIEKINHQMVTGCSVDDDYLLVASHVDEVIRQKVIAHEYIDFAKLLRKD